MTDTDGWGRTKHPEPVTFADRVAFALAAHDIGGGEGRLEDDELDAVRLALRTTPWNHLLGGKACQQALRRLLILEEGLRCKGTGDALMHAHLTRSRWQDYLPAARAVLAVLVERPEFAKTIEEENADILAAARAFVEKNG